ncbi:MAG: carbohydrate-binding protein [Bacteroidetes bacterium]|nr:MAG: carbohydrate-binding protein [Bacteroidota bacterium]
MLYFELDMCDVMNKGLLLLSLLILGWACSRTPETRVTRSEKKILLVRAEFGKEDPLLTQIQKTCQDSAWELVSVYHRGWLSEDTIRDYSAVILHGWMGESFTIQQQSDLQRYIQAGGAMIALNTSIHTRLVWPWLEEALDQHPDDTLASANTMVADEGLFVAKKFDGGRVFYPSFEDPSAVPGLPSAVGKLIHDAIGDNNSYDYALATALPAPRDNRFTRLVLDEGDVNEPMELAVLPDERVIYIERRGKMKMYHPKTKKVTLLATFDVCTEGNYEDGLLGLAADPNFNQNHYIYLYYSPPCQIKSQYLSRFTMIGDSLIKGSEKVVMEVPVQRETCCHSGGSVKFGPDGCLYLSTGDNTSSKESDGYTPIDEREGRSPWDAQKSSSNASDLRGKVLRIKPNAFGGYDIPEGNLFPKDGSQGRPEIYTMGCRNPFRIEVDSKTGWLYWGDVGPDVGADGKYGPQSYDEFNQARGPGNFGWPYFVANNKAYRDRDFSTDSLGETFNPASPVNMSPNNVGPRNLPPATPAMIWYPYGNSDRFPLLGNGSRSAMSGPIYHRTAAHEVSKTAFPSYYEGKWFIYEWARSWIRVVTFDSAGLPARIEPFMPSLKLVKPIEMEFGPDGSLYVLEYGQDYFMKNPDARLIKIEFAAKNRAPIPEIQVDAQEGAAPFTVHFSAQGSREYDPNDSLCFEWYFQDTSQPHALTTEAEFTFTQPGIYHPLLVVTDTYGDTAQARVEIRVGNAPPDIRIALQGNSQFYFAGENRPYEVQILDPEDQSSGGIDPAKTQINFAYIPDGNDLDLSLGGGRLGANLQYLRGWNLIQSSDCMSCHALETHSVGPSYTEVARKYKGDATAVAYLSRKIITGGNGVWGEKIMAGHPQHSPEETAEMAKYILSLADEGSNGRLPTSGSISTNQASATGAYIFAATYTDRGGNGLPSLMRRKSVILRPPRIEAEKVPVIPGTWVMTAGPSQEVALLRGLRNGSVLRFPQVDISGIGAAILHYGAVEGGSVSLRMDSPDGPLLAEWRVGRSSGQPVLLEARASLKATQGLHDLYLVFSGAPDTEILALDALGFSK